jgi:hypothetical protein
VDKVLCIELWRDWMINSPQDSQVIECKQNISKFSKDDWTVMSEEAIYLIQNLVDLVLNKTPLKDKASEDSFDLFIKHIDEWFFIVNKTFAIKIIYSCQTNDKFFQFFDGFHPGLTKHVAKLMMVYLHKLPD